MILNKEPSLYCKYLREREDADILESQYGFIAYKIQGEECFIKDTFVDEAIRGSGHFSILFNELELIAKEKKCSHITGVIWIADPNHEDTIKTAFHLGFRIHQAINDGLKIVYKVEGE